MVRLRIALDTNRYVDLAKGDEAVVQTVEFSETVYLPFIVLAELRAGFAAGRNIKANERALGAFLAKAGVDILYADESTIDVYALLYRQLRQQGTPIPAHDLWIAALVVQHGLVLLTRDAHFDVLPQINRA